MDENHELEDILTGIGSEPVPDDIQQLAENVVDEFRRGLSAGLASIPLESQDATAATRQEASPRGDEPAISQDPTRPAVRLVPDVPTELADGVSCETHPIEKPPSRRHAHWRLVAMSKQRTVRWSVAAAVVAIAVLGGLSFRPRVAPPGEKQTRWWLGPVSTWAAEIDAAVATIKGVTCREQWQTVDANGVGAAGSTWTKFYVSHDSYRRDIHDGDFLREIQWYTPDGKDMLQTGVRFDTKSYCVLRHHGSFGQEDPVQRIRFYAGLLDKANRQLGTTVIDGHECVGFEIRASRYGSNPDSWVDRIWFDVNSRLPVRIENAGRPVTGDAARTFTKVQDRFDYNPALSPDTFTPSIPQGFINAHPDELKARQSPSGK